MAYSPQYIGDASEVLPKLEHTFYFLRHGQTDWNARQYAQGSRDIPLNETGENQAKVVQPIVAGLPVQLVATSPLGRAEKTARLATAGLNIDIVLAEGLRERGFGPHEGTIPPEEMFIGNYEGCENTVEFAKRVAQELAEHCKQGGRLLVAHGGVLRVILSLLKTTVDQSGLGNARVLRFDVKDGEWTVTVLSPEQVMAARILEYVGKAS